MGIKSIMANHQVPVIMEQVAMYMVALPCPPLPVLVSSASFKGNKEKEEDDDNDEEVEKWMVCSSHDLLAGLLICAMQRNDQTQNETRKKKQIELTQTFIDSILGKSVGKLSVDDNIVDAMYTMCQSFTGEYIFSFDDPGNPCPAVRFMNIDDVAKGDKVHSACCSWHRGQAILHAKHQKKETADSSTIDINNEYSTLSYRELIKKHCERIIQDGNLAQERLLVSSQLRQV